MSQARLLTRLSGVAFWLCCLACLPEQKGPPAPTPDDFSVRGIDIARYQGKINWPVLAARGGIHFAYMKATEGATYRDPLFTRNWRLSARVGLMRGAYHYFTFCRSGRDQFENFRRVVPREKRALPVMVDLEYWGNCDARPPVMEMEKELGEFLKRAELHYGKRPVLYISWGFYYEYWRFMALSNSLWVRDTEYYPRYGPDWIIWQFSEKGKVPGIPAAVDLNVYQHDLERFKNWARSGFE